MTDTSKEAVERLAQDCVLCDCDAPNECTDDHCAFGVRVAATLRALSARNRQLEMEGISSFCEAQAAYEAQVVLEAKLDEAVEVLDRYWEGSYFTGVSIFDAQRINATLAKIKAEKE